jgi:ketosteroid isomerase-like protein
VFETAAKEDCNGLTGPWLSEGLPGRRGSVSRVDAQGKRPAANADVEALRRVYAEWGRGNFRPRPDVYADDMEWGWSDEFPGLERVSHDPSLRSRRLREFLSQWEDWRCEAEDYVQDGEFVVVLCRYRGRGKESGVEVDTRGAHLWTMRDGKVVRLEVFSSRRRALEVIGHERGNPQRRESEQWHSRS